MAERLPVWNKENVPNVIISIEAHKRVLHGRLTDAFTTEWCNDDQMFVCRMDEHQYVTGHGNTRFEAIRMCLDNFEAYLSW